MCKRIRIELSIVNEWSCVNILSFNLEKTHFILFTNCKSVKNPVIRINDNFFERVKDTNLWVFISMKIYSGWITYHILVTSYQQVLQYLTVLAVSLL